MQKVQLSRQPSCTLTKARWWPSKRRDAGAAARARRSRPQLLGEACLVGDDARDAGQLRDGLGIAGGVAAHDDDGALRGCWCSRRIVCRLLASPSAVTVQVLTTHRSAGSSSPASR